MIGSGEAKTHNGAWHLWRSTSCGMLEGGGGDQLKKADEDEMFRNLQADVWAYETEGAFN